MKKKIIFLCFSLLIFLSTLIFSQGPGEPYFPETANGAHNTSFQYHSLRWQNPIGTNYNEIYISYDSSKVANIDPSVLYISGYPSTAFDSIRINQQLYYPTRYFWCVVEYNSIGFTQGEVWHFTTTRDDIDFDQLDDFSFGLGKWTIENIGGCGWQIGESANYTLPLPSTSKLLRADKSICGNTINATAYFQQVDIMKYMYYARLEFNSDWKTENPNDFARIDMSTDNGYSWSTIWQKIGISDRNMHINLPLFYSNWDPDTIYTLQVRFKTFQNGTNSWWAIDNIGIIGQDGILTHVHPQSLHVDVIDENQQSVFLKWYQILPEPFENVEKKIGSPTDTNSYQIIATVQSSYITTFIDSTITDSTIYTYRIGIEEGWINSWYVYSNEATAYIFPIVPIELTSFTSEAIGNSVKLNWSTATETNNSGFEILRFAQNDQKGWEKIGFVPGSGTTTEVHKYSFLDEELQTGNYQYRLKQIDFDGTFEYSNIIEVTVDAPTKFVLERNYPNPFNPTTKIKYTVPTVIASIAMQFQLITLKVYDLLGREVAVLVNEEKPADTYEVGFDATALPSGIYFYQLKAGNFIETKKMILLK
jgi:hypothetical protein